jgi:hypothetical protein
MEYLIQYIRFMRRRVDIQIIAGLWHNHFCQIRHLSNNDLYIYSNDSTRQFQNSHMRTYVNAHISLDKLYEQQSNIWMLRIFHPSKILTYSFIQIVDISNTVL